MLPQIPHIRLQQLAAEQGYSWSTLSKVIKRNRGYIRSYIVDRVPRELDDADAERLARFFGIEDSAFKGS